MTRVDLMTDGRLIELLTEAALVHDPMPEVAVVPPAVLAEVARRVAERQHRREIRHTTGP